MLLGKEMAVERKLDRPIEEQEAESKRARSRSPPAPTCSDTLRRANTEPLNLGEADFRDLYESEHAKNIKLLAIVREQRRTIQSLEENAKRMKAISKILQGGRASGEPDSWRNSPQNSVCGLDTDMKIKIGDTDAEDSRSFHRRSGARSKSKLRFSNLSPLPSPIPGRWSQFTRSPSPSPKPSFSNSFSVPSRETCMRTSVNSSPVNPGTVDFRCSTGSGSPGSPPPLDIAIKSPPSAERKGYSAFGSKEVVPRSRSGSKMSLLDIDRSKTM